jgi:HK97 family phage major capsid protein
MSNTTARQRLAALLDANPAFSATLRMEATGVTARERLEDAVKAARAAEAVVLEKGAAASDEDHTNLETAVDQMMRATAAFAAANAIGEAGAQLDNLGETLPDGRTYDDLASASGIVNPNRSPGMTLGEAFTQSPAYRDLLATHRRSDGTLSQGIGKSGAFDIAVSLQHLIDGNTRYALDTLVTGESDSSAGAIVAQPTRVPGIADLAPLRMPRILQLMTRIPVTTDAFEWLQIATKTNAAAPVAEATTAVAESIDGVKPESAITFTSVTKVVETIAHHIPVTRRAAADAPQLMQILNVFLFAGLAVEMEDQVLTGNGTSPQLQGLINTTMPWNILTFDLADNGAPSRLDAIALAAGAIYDERLGTSWPNAILIHPLDWFSEDFALAKDDFGRYHGPGPWQQLQMLSPWGFQPVVTHAVDQGTQVLGDWTQALWADRQQASLYMTDSHAAEFTSNILRVLVEARLSFGVRIPEAFIQIFDGGS